MPREATQICAHRPICTRNQNPSMHQAHGSGHAKLRARPCLQKARHGNVLPMYSKVPMPFASAPTMSCATNHMLTA